MSPNEQAGPHVAMIQNLDGFTGCWFGSTQVYPSPLFPSRAMLSTSCKSSLDLAGRVIVGRELHRLSGCVVYQALSLLRWDAVREQYALQRFDTSERPFAEPAFGEWNGRSLLFEWTTAQGHARAEYALEDDLHYTLRITTRSKGEPRTPVLESRLERHGQ